MPQIGNTKSPQQLPKRTGIYLEHFMSQAPGCKWWQRYFSILQLRNIRLSLLSHAASYSEQTAQLSQTLTSEEALLATQCVLKKPSRDRLARETSSYMRMYFS